MLKFFVDLQTGLCASFQPIYQGLSGAQAAWANKKYHRYHILPSNMVVFVKETITE
jgi:hypothetical protein